MPHKKSKQPAYRHRVLRGKHKAVVTLVDAVTKKVKDHFLGEWNSPESRIRYNQTLAQWEARGRRLEEPNQNRAEASVVEMVAAYWEGLAGRIYCPSEARHIRVAWQGLVDLFGTEPIRTFTPNKLRLVRKAMVQRGWSRRYINRQVYRAVRIFKWGVGHDFCPALVVTALEAVPPLRCGETAAPETEPVGPVDVNRVARVKPYLSPVLRDVVELQLLTGARASEILNLRTRDICFDDPACWQAVLTKHKMSHKTAKPRTLFFGPAAQAILQPYLLRPEDAYLFSPAESARKRREERSQQRQTPLSCGNIPGSNLKDEPQRRPGPRYSTEAYGHAIYFACEQALAMPGHYLPNAADQLRPEDGPEQIGRKNHRRRQRAKLRARWHARYGWHSHQLRHTAATVFRKAFGAEAASILLGHSSMELTDAVYAERDLEKAKAVIAKIG